MHNTGQLNPDLCVPNVHISDFIFCKSKSPKAGSKMLKSKVLASTVQPSQSLASVKKQQQNKKNSHTKKGSRCLHKQATLLSHFNYTDFNPFMLSGVFYLNSLDRSISSRRGVWLFLLLLCFIESPVFNANSVDSDQMLHSAASDLGLHCLPMSLFMGC